MIPGADHNSRSLAFRRIRSLSEVTNSPPRHDADNPQTHTSNTDTNDNNNNNRRRRPPPFLQLTSSITDDDGNEIEISNSDDELTSPLLQVPRHTVPSLEYEEQSDSSSMGSWLLVGDENQSKATNWKLWVVFSFLVASGVGNVIFAKLQSMPMYNYPTFLNIYANGMYVVMSFTYILPVSFLGLFGNPIPRVVPSRAIKPFFIMGGLDALGAAMQVLATVYLPGTLLVLLPQVAIPLSMAAGSLVLREKYTVRQYAGAVVVFCGILVVLYPILSHQIEANHYCKAINSDSDCILCREETTEEDCISHNSNKQNPNFPFDFGHNKNATGGDDSGDADEYFCVWVSREEASVRDEDFLVFFWSIVMILSCVPSVMSTVYKQLALQTATSMDPILINGWVCLFQLICGLFLVVPSGLVSSPRVHPLKIGSNWLAGFGCLFTQTNSIETGCHPDDCSEAALWVHISLVNSVVYALSMLFVLKYGSCDLMYLGLTLVVPLGHLAFDCHSSFANLRIYDMAGLVILVLGLMLYRFGNSRKPRMDETVERNIDNNDHPYELMIGEDDDNEAEHAETSSNQQLGNVNANTNNTANSHHDKEGFLEFLREPFMLAGDI